MDTLDRIKNNTLLHRSAGTQGNNDPILNNNKILNWVLTEDAQRNTIIMSYVSVCGWKYVLIL